MNTSHPPPPRRISFGILALVLLGSSTVAQPVKTPTAPPTAADTIQLTPFEVSSSRDQGFVAASSLAGGRLAGDLKDTPVAYSVINREFIDALNLTNLADAAGWSPNTVLSINPDGSGIGADYSFSQGSFNVRGAGGGRQRNFFSYNAPMDSYSVERYDFGRGPNAILFGNGGLGGVNSTMTKQARFDSTFGAIQATVGSWNTLRTTFDYNRPLNDKFAVRVATLFAEADGWRQRMFKNDRAAFLTLTYKPARYTSIRVEGEYGGGQSTQTLNNIQDRFSGWDGKTTYSGPMAVVPANNIQLGVSRRGADYLIYDPAGSKRVMNYVNDPYTLAGGENVLTPVGGFVAGAGNANFNVTNSMILFALNTPGNRFDNAIAGSKFRVPSTRFTNQSDAPTLDQHYKDVQATIDHRFGPVFLQAAVDLNRTRAQTINIDVNGVGQTYIDINSLLPNGAANPHFLEPYGDAPIRRSNWTRDAEGSRLALGYAKDAGKWGNYTTNAMLGSTTTKHSQLAFNQSVAQNADHRRWGTAGLNAPALDMIRIRRYWNEPSKPINIPGPVRYTNAVTGVDKEITPMWALMNDRTDVVQFSKNEYKYALAAVNAKYFSNRLVLLGAVRRDSFKNKVTSQSEWGDYSATTWDGVTPRYKPDAPADYATLTYVPRDANGVATGPAVSADTRPRDANGNRLAQYAIDRFRNDYIAPVVNKSEVTRTVGGVFHLTKWLSPYLNYAETFNAPSSQQRIDSSFLPPTVAKGVDLGLRASLLDGRLNLSVLQYRNSEKNATFTQSTGGDINVIASANPLGDTSVNGRNRRTFENVPAVFVDMQDREARGYELELTANPTRQWRLTFNVGLPKVYSTNAARDQIRFYDANKAMLKQIVLDAGGLVDASDVASVDTSIAVNDRSPDVNAAVNSYNNLRNTRANFVSQRRISQDQPSVNFYNDYTVGSGRLKGLRLGAGVQYRGKQIVGYRAADTIVNPADPTRAIDNPNVDAYTAVFTPNSYHTVVATLGYTLRLKERRQVEFNLKLDSVLNSQGPLYAGNSAVLRPLGGNYSSPARETVANIYMLKQPISFMFTTTLKL
jgi:outer membrane receptor for ferric coprogen and ferric-rhodotorulic acid